MFKNLAIFIAGFAAHLFCSVYALSYTVSVSFLIQFTLFHYFLVAAQRTLKSRLEIHSFMTLVDFNLFASVNFCSALHNTIILFVVIASTVDSQTHNFFLARKTRSALPTSLPLSGNTLCWLDRMAACEPAIKDRALNKHKQLLLKFQIVCR